MYYKSCFENGIKFINDLTNNDGSIYTYDELKATYNVTINFLQYSGLIRSILAWKNPIIPFSVQIYLKSKKRSTRHVQSTKQNNRHPRWKKSLGLKNINLKKTSGEKYFLTHLKSPKTVQFNGSKAELIIKF